MKVFCAIFFLLFSLEVIAIDEAATFSDLESMLKNLNNFSKEIDKLLGNKKTDCHIYPDEGSIKNCHLTNYCQILVNNSEGSFVRKLPNGESILNERLYSLYNKDLKECLTKHLFKDEIAKKLDEFKNKQVQIHLKEVFDLNQKLLSSIKKHNELSKYALLNQELISQNLQTDIDSNSDTINSGKSSNEFKLQLQSIQKKLKIKLSTSTIQLLVELNLKIQGKNFDADEKKFEASMYPELKTPDIFYDLNNFTDVNLVGSKEKLLQNQELYNLKAQKVFDIFAEAKERVINYLESQKDELNKEQMNRAIDRVKLVKFLTPTVNDNLKAECSRPNAFYAASTQTITVCPQWFNSPSVFLLQTLAHEIGHSIDPCHLQYPLKIHNATVDIVVEGEFNTTINMPKLKSSETITEFPFNEKLRPQDQTPTFIKDGPFTKTIECLQNEKSIGALYPSKTAIAEKINAQIELMKKNQQDPASNAAYGSLLFTQQHLDEYFERFGACEQGYPGGVSQMQEAFADKIASDVMAQKFRVMDKKLAQEEIENYALSEIAGDSDVCSDGDLTKQVKDKMQQMGCPIIYSNKTNTEKFDQGLSIASKFNSDPHPPTVNRIDKIFMANPDIRKILNCTDDGVKYCEK